MSRAEELAEQMFPEPQMENYDDILEYRNDRDWTFIARGAFVKGYDQAKEEMMKDAIECHIDYYDGPILDFTQKQLDDVLEKNGAKVGDKVKVIIIKE